MDRLDTSIGDSRESVIHQQNNVQLYLAALRSTNTKTDGEAWKKERRIGYLQPEGGMVVGVLIQALIVRRIVGFLMEVTTHMHPLALALDGGVGMVSVRGD